MTCSHEPMALTYGHLATEKKIIYQVISFKLNLFSFELSVFVANPKVINS